jgi:chondroitin sulfate proteoglycan 4
LAYLFSGEPKGHFTFHVLDGATSTKRHRFVIKAQQLILELKRNRHIDVFPTTIQTISSDNLLAVTNDVNQSRPIVYTLQRKPKYGQLVNRYNKAVELESFTQEDVDRGNVGYLQSETVGSWKGKDLFIFEIQTDFANSITYRKFEIHISYETVKGDNVKQLIGMSRAHVEEGGTVTFTKQNLNMTNLMVLLQNVGVLNPHVRFIIRELPQHGELLFDGQTITIGTNFLQQDINEQRMKYMHDDSDSLMDSFKFMVLVGTSDLDPDMTKIHDHDDIVFNITILPINDEEFELITRSPSITVLQGSTSFITKKDLEVMDPDTGPAEIVFHIINGPTNGFLAKSDSLNRPVSQFTQADLNSKNLMFIHNGGQEEGSFYFKVTDGKFNDVYKVFKISITPLTLEVTSSNVQLMQGQTSIVFTPNDIESSTNGKREEIKFNITRVPQFGKVFVNDLPSRHFAQLDVDEQQVVYVQTDLSVSMDTFEFSAYNSKLVSPYHKVNITVKPLVKQKPFNISFSESTPLTINVLDATELAALTGSNPWYEIIKHPLYGKFTRLWIKRDTTGHHKKGRLQSFTHEDIVNRQILFEAGAPPGDELKAEDGFSYILYADSAQPAQGKLTIAMQPPKPPVIKNGQTNPSTGGDNQTQNPQNTKAPPKVETKSPAGSSVIKRDHLLILFVVVGLIVVALVILILIKCIHKPSPSKTPRVQDKPNQPQSAFEQSSSREGTLDRVPPTYNSLPSIRVTQDTLPHDQRQQTLTPIQSLAAARTYSPTDSSLGSAGSGDQTTRKVPVRVMPVHDQDETEVKRPLPPGARGHGRTRVRGGPSGGGPSGDLNEHVTFDWESCDPELLQHVRTTNPVLKDSKYWV